MFKSMQFVAGALATVTLSASAVAGPISPIEPVITQTPIRGPMPGVIYCSADPAIASVTLTKGARRGQVRISYEVVNVGATGWSSGANQQLVHLSALNASTGRTFVRDTPLTGSARSGAVMQRYASPTIENAFDDFEFAGALTVQINYDPDILIDGNRCNDDADTGNNVVHLDNSDILDFMNGAAPSRTYRP